MAVRTVGERVDSCDSAGENMAHASKLPYRTILVSTPDSRKATRDETAPFVLDACACPPCWCRGFAAGGSEAEVCVRGPDERCELG